MLEMEHLLLDLLTHRALLPESVRDPSYAERDELLLQKPLGVLNAGFLPSASNVHHRFCA